MNQQVYIMEIVLHNTVRYFNMIMKHISIFILITLTFQSAMAQKKQPFRIGVAGLTHTHVHWILARAKDGDIEIVGIAEKNRDLADRYIKQYNLSPTLLFSSLTEMLDKAKPEAVTAFNSIYEHLETVQTCAPRGVHVMVEKPLAVSLDHAKKMQALAQKHNIELLTNYETTWYATNHKTKDTLQLIGDIRKIVVHDGHQGPKEIGVNKEFLEWLTDPHYNGGGALIDFGCYGANLSTWLMKGEKPLSVVAVTQTIKPDVYPKVDDEATIILKYPKAQSIIQASWNWPYSRKDMEVYGVTGSIFADRDNLRIKASADQPDVSQKVKPLETPRHDPFAYFAAVVRKEINPTPADLSSLQNNMIVMEILDAAKRSASTGKAIELR
jgi:predicted dehydrogenase